MKYKEILNKHKEIITCAEEFNHTVEEGTDKHGEHYFIIGGEREGFCTYADSLAECIELMYDSYILSAGFITLENIKKNTTTVEFKMERGIDMTHPNLPNLPEVIGGKGYCSCMADGKPKAVGCANPCKYNAFPTC